MGWGGSEVDGVKWIGCGRVDGVRGWMGRGGVGWGGRGWMGRGGGEGVGWEWGGSWVGWDVPELGCCLKVKESLHSTAVSPQRSRRGPSTGARVACAVGCLQLLS